MMMMPQHNEAPHVEGVSGGVGGGDDMFYFC